MDPERCDGGAGETGRRCTRHDPLRTADRRQELVAGVAITVGNADDRDGSKRIFPTGGATWPIRPRIDATITDRTNHGQDEAGDLPTASPITAPIPMNETVALGSWI